MKLVDLQLDEVNGYLKITDLENFFDVLEDKRKNTVYDLNSTVYLNVNPKELPTFVCDCVAQWPLLSYKIYGTTRLAWLLQKLNNASASDILQSKKPGDEVKYLPTQYVDGIVSELNSLDEA